MTTEGLGRSCGAAEGKARDKRRRVSLDVFQWTRPVLAAAGSSFTRQILMNLFRPNEITERLRLRPGAYPRPLRRWGRRRLYPRRGALRHLAWHEPQVHLAYRNPSTYFFLRNIMIAFQRLSSYTRRCSRIVTYSVDLKIPGMLIL